VAAIGGASPTARNEHHFMNRIHPIDPENATGDTRRLLDIVQARFGSIPNLTRVLANAPAALRGYLDLSAALAGGTYTDPERERISLAVAETNLCAYCLSAHTAIARKAGLSDEEIADARHATAASVTSDAALKLARSIVMQRGELSDADFAAARAAGLSDGAIVETVANVAMNIFTNYLSHVARTAVDFPLVKPGNGYAPKRANAPGA